MTNNELIMYAKTYVDKLANGINPLTDEPVGENDVVNNVRISRCLFFVSDILKQAACGNIHPSKKGKKEPFHIQPEKKDEYVFSDIPVSMTEIINQLNSLANTEECKKITHANVTDWLMNAGLLSLNEYNGKTYKCPTGSGNEMGISMEKRMGYSGEYLAVLYNSEAQRFILDNLEAIIAMADSKPKGENEGHPWKDEHTRLLLEMNQKNVPIPEMASVLQRSETSVRMRLRKLGLLENYS